MRILVALVALLLAAAPAGAATLVVVGDSISAGYGVPTGRGWVNLLQAKVAPAGHVVVNASVSGDTTAGSRDRRRAARHSLN